MLLYALQFAKVGILNFFAVYFHEIEQYSSMTSFSLITITCV